MDVRTRSAASEYCPLTLISSLTHQQENTRLRKVSTNTFELLIASAVQTIPLTGGDIGKTTEYTLESGPITGAKIKLVYGDYSREMSIISQYSEKAAECASEGTQREMHLAYAKAFHNGSMKAYKDSQRLWIKDIKPTVECNMGFVETYRDPKRVRGEWETFVAIVNQDRTRAFTALVDAAASMIPRLPWPREFEKDKFLSPDFTSLEVLSFASSCLPYGINIVSNSPVARGHMLTFS